MFQCSYFREMLAPKLGINMGRCSEAQKKTFQAKLKKCQGHRPYCHMAHNMPGMIVILPRNTTIVSSGIILNKFCPV